MTTSTHNNNTPSPSVYDVRDYTAYKYAVIDTCVGLVARLREHEYTPHVRRTISTLLRTSDDLRNMSPSEVDWQYVDECVEDAIDYLDHMSYRGCL